ncbi:GumC family protein [Lutibacter sp.]
MKENKNFDFLYLEDEDDTINIREVVDKYRYYYKWFLLGIIIALIGAFLYLRYTPKQYEVASTILIDDQKKGGLSSELSAFADLGLMGGVRTSIDNEIGILKSRSLMERVVKNLKLNIKFYYQGRVTQTELYKNRVPFKISFNVKDSILRKLDTSFTITRMAKNAFMLKNSEGEEVSKQYYGESVTTNFGSFVVTPNSLENKHVNQEIKVTISPLELVANAYQKNIKIEPYDKKSSLINLSLKDNIKQRAKDILDYLVNQYNKDAIEDKSFIAKNTDAFINERLEVISKDLTVVDKGVENFKTKNNLTDVVVEAGLILTSNQSVQQKIIGLQTQLKLVEYVTNYINSNTTNLIPANLGLADENTNQSTVQYNELLLERNRILKSSGKLNPIILNLDDQILKLQQSIKQGLVNLKSSLTISLNAAKKEEMHLNSKITSVPKQEREYRDIQRQQQIIETLYLYLLQKREENAITLAVTAPNAKVIDRAYGSSIPVAPKPRLIYMAAILVGVIIPLIVLYLIFLFDNKVHTSDELETEIKAPILGDIPETTSEDKIVILENDESGVAESFRMLRTNVTFMLTGVKGTSKIIFLTSTIKGEGKTFTAINLATILAMAKKKVLVVGADIRSPKLAAYLNIREEKGLTHFLTDNQLQVKNVIQHVKATGFDMIQSGIIAPNPSELLMNGRFDEVIAYGKQHYDYVIVDTPPVSVVTDTLILSKNNADLFIYVVRANYLDKRLLKIPKKLYNEKRLPNMAMLINCTNPLKGYGYGYGYGYGNEVKKPWWKRF